MHRRVCSHPPTLNTNCFCSVLVSVINSDNEAVSISRLEDFWEQVVTPEGLTVTATHLGPIFLHIHFINHDEGISAALVSFKCQMHCIYDIIHHQPIHVISGVTCMCTFETATQRVNYCAM